MFAWRDGQVVKLLRAGFPERLVDEEEEVGRLVTADHLAAPRLYGRIQIDGRPGLVFDRVSGGTMLATLSRRPWQVDRVATQLAVLHAQMHSADGNGLPRQRDGFRHAIERAIPTLGNDRARYVLDRLGTLTDGSALCHGDMHPGNVLMESAGPVVIDWMSASSGAAEADVARTVFLLSGSRIPTSYPTIQGFLINTVRHRFTATYLACLRPTTTARSDEPRAMESCRPRCPTQRAD